MADKDKKKERQQKKVDRFTEQKNLEAERTGTNKPIDIGPSGPERKARIDAAIKEGVKKDFIGGLEKIQKLRTAPDVTVPDIPKTDYNIKDVRRERRAKIADVLTGLGSGLRGERVNPKMYQDKLKSERDTQYQQYRDASTSAKKRLSEWETGYIDEQLNYLDKLSQDPKTSERELKQIEILSEKLRYEKAKAGLEEKKLRDYKKPSEKETDKYATETYETSTGKTIRRPILADGDQLEKEIEADIELKRQIEPIDSEIENIQKELNVLKLTKKDDDSALRSVDIATKQAKINSLKAKRDKLIQENKSKPNNTVSTTESKPTGITEEDDLWNL